MISTRALLAIWALTVLQPFSPAPAQTNLDEALGTYSDNILKNIVAPNLLNYAKLEAHGASSYSIGKDNYGDFIALNVVPDQIVQDNAVSTEIAIDYPFMEGDTVRYSWRMQIPNSSVSDAPQNRWWLLARWNDQPNTKIGEKKEDFLSYNPTVLFGYKQVDGKDIISISSGVPDLITAGSFSIRKGQWVKFTVVVTWSRSDKGRAAIYINDSKLPEREISGPNMYSGYHNVFRLGISRSTDIRTNASIHIGDVKVERIAAAPAGTLAPSR